MAGVSSAHREAVVSLGLDQLGAWLSAAIPGAGTRVTATLITGGRSNLTYLVSDGRGEWIVRRPPLGHVLASAHDMGREYRVMTALCGTPIPVPRTFGSCDDPGVVGAPFYVMERVEGTSYHSAAELEALGADRTRTISTRLVETLGALHRVVPGDVGLADFGRPEGYLARQVARWKKQLDGSRTRDLPDADELHSRVAADVPAESAVGIVHGDFRLDNMLILDDQVTAVLDWEMATLGDPLSDLALMLVYKRFGVGASIGPDPRTAASGAPGFVSESEIIELYCAITDCDLTRFGFYLGLAAYKLAAVLEGIHYRYLQGQTVGEGFDRAGLLVPDLLEAGLEALKDDRG